MVCKKCGSEVTANMRFCNACGEAVAETIIQRDPVSEPVKIVTGSEAKPTEEVSEAKKTEKKSNWFGAVLVTLIVAMVITSLLSWCSLYVAIYGGINELSDEYKTDYTVFSLHEMAEFDLEWIEEYYDNEWLDEEYDRNAYEVTVVFFIVSAVVSVILLISFMLLLIAVFLFVMEKRAAKIYSIIAGIFMFIASGAFAAFVPIISKLYGHTILMEANPALYATIGLSFLITILSFFYKRKKYDTVY